MSPSTVRRYRAERLLRREFARLRGEVLKGVRGRMRARGVHLDEGDLEACYAQAWQGLYAAVAAGEEVANPGGWLAVVTYRRAIDEHRSATARGLATTVSLDAAGGREVPGRVRTAPASAAGGPRAAYAERDFAAELDDRARLRQLFEALRSRLDARECEAASLCYLQGYTRAQAAQRMGISETRMTKLMEGRGAGRPGVAAKVGELLETVGGGRWCEQQSSLMRGFALGILDPAGDRYRLARLHQRECPACRAYVLSLRGLAAVLPPLPLPWMLVPHPAPAGHGPAVHASAANAGANGGATAGANTGTAAGTNAGTAAGANAGAAAGTNAGTAAGANAGAAAASAGAAGAGGGWLLGGSVGAKLAVSCLLALSVGCVSLVTAPHRPPRHRDRGVSRHRAAAAAGASVAEVPSTLGGDALASARVFASATPTSPRASGASGRERHVSPIARAAAVRRSQARHAQREFGLERAAASAAAPGASAASSSEGASQPAQPVAQVASAGSTTPASGAAGATESSAGQNPAPSAPPSRAEREFGPE